MFKGTPKATLSVHEISKIACKEAEIYAQHSFVKFSHKSVLHHERYYNVNCLLQDGIIIENMHDTPYCKAPLGPEIIASMCRISHDVKKILPDIPCGIQVKCFYTK